MTFNTRFRALGLAIALAAGASACWRPPAPWEIIRGHDRHDGDRGDRWERGRDHDRNYERDRWERRSDRYQRRR